jgi:hypothetical protein
MEACHHSINTAAHVQPNQAQPRRLLTGGPRPPALCSRPGLLGASTDTQLTPNRTTGPPHWGGARMPCLHSCTEVAVRECGACPGLQLTAGGGLRPRAARNHYRTAGKHAVSGGVRRGRGASPPVAASSSGWVKVAATEWVRRRPMRAAAAMVDCLMVQRAPACCRLTAAAALHCRATMAASPPLAAIPNTGSHRRSCRAPARCSRGALPSCSAVLCGRGSRSSL